MKILITGCNGFLGRILAKEFYRLGYLCLNAHRRPLPDVLGIQNTVFVGDINRNTQWEEALVGVDVVIHTAAKVHVFSGGDYDEICEVNTLGVLRIASESARLGVNRFIYISSVNVGLNVDFESLSEINSSRDLFSRAKYEAEKELVKLSKKSGMEIVIIRPPLIYGEGVKANFASLMRFIGQGYPLPFRAIKDNKRSLVSAYNLVDLIRVCIDHPKAANQVFLVSDDDDLSTSQIVALMAKVQVKANVSIPVPIWCFKLVGKVFKKEAVVDLLIGSLQLNIDHTKNMLDWTPPYSVEHGFKLAAGSVLK
jgi:UDP-glucose 4-epimerase